MSRFGATGQWWRRSPPRRPLRKWLQRAVYARQRFT
jgi:hypothetical protein